MDERESPDHLEQMQHGLMTSGLEQEIESLRKGLSLCSREKKNLEEELTELYKIKSQLADLYNAEVLKNREAEKQVKFFQSCVAAAFSERDRALMEFEKAKESEEVMSKKFTGLENRILELNSSCLFERGRNDAQQIEIMEFKAQNENFMRVVSKFFEIRERDSGFSLSNTLQDKCSCLLEDPSDKWMYSDDSQTSTSKYIASLEEEAEALRNSLDKLQNNLRMGLEIEEHLRRRVKSLEENKITWEDTMRSQIVLLHDFHLQLRTEVMKILEGENNQFKLILAEVQDKISEFCKDQESRIENIQREKVSDDTECRDVHISGEVDSSTSMKSELSITDTANKFPNASDALALALQEKVSALLLLSQQEEMYFLERDMKNALQKKMEELQKNLAQVTEEKVKVLLELAQLKREYQLVHEGTMKHGVSEISEKPIGIHEHEGKIKNFLKKTSLRCWIGKDVNEYDYDIQGCSGESNQTCKIIPWTLQG